MLHCTISDCIIFTIIYGEIRKTTSCIYTLQPKKILLFMEIKNLISLHGLRRIVLNSRWEGAETKKVSLKI